MSFRTRHGMDRARDAAWTAFGLRFWKWFVAAAVIRTVGPFLAIVATVGLLLGGTWLGVGWVREHTGDDRHPAPAPSGTVPVEASAPRPDGGWDVLPGPGWVWALIPAILAVVAFGVAYARTPVPVWHRPGGVRALSLAVAGVAVVGVLLFLAGGR